MLDTVQTRPNHYQRLGLKPDAGKEEIARAFATAMSPLMPRTVRDLAEIAVAFETLRDPEKRRAYDAAIAPPPEPEPGPEVEAEAEPKAMFPREGWPFTPSARIGSAEMPAIGSLPRAPAKAKAEAKAKATPPAPAFEEPLRPVAEEPFRYAEPGPVQWKRPALTIGGLFLGVAVIGAGLGWYASRGIPPAQAEQPVTFPVPKAEAAGQAPAAGQTSAAPVSARAEPRSRAAKAPVRTQAKRKPEPVLAQEQKAEDVPDIPSEQVAALASSAAEEGPAAIPLPDSVIARTIGRIGYACGEVASTTAVEGSPGVFKVTCTSGHAYRAAPVRGRYHFRRWSGG